MTTFFEEEKAEATAWAKEVLADPQAVILDSETTAMWGEIVELAILGINGEVLFNQLIKPIEGITREAEAIHGISNDAVAEALGFTRVYGEIADIMQAASRVVIYNAQYDVGRLDHCCRIVGLPLIKYRVECAMEQYARWHGQWSEYHGSFTWQKLDGGHRALGDCRATLDIIKRMAADGEGDVAKG